MFEYLRVPMARRFLGVSLVAIGLAAPGGATTMTATTAKPMVRAAGGVGSPVELTYWQSIATSNDIAQYDAYLARYPRGTFAKLARLKIASLMAQQDAAGVEQVEVAGPIDEAPVGKAVLPASGRAVAATPVATQPAAAPTVMASAAGTAEQVAEAVPLPSPPLAAASAPWSAARLGPKMAAVAGPSRDEEREGQAPVRADDLGRTQAQQDLAGEAVAQQDAGPAPWERQGEAQAPEQGQGQLEEQEQGQDQAQAQEEQSSAPAWPAGEERQTMASPPLPPYFDREIVPPQRYSSPGQVRAALPLRPRLASFRPLDLPRGFCSLASREDYLMEQFRPAAEAAEDNEERANAYLRAVQAQYDHYKFDGDTTGANITGQERVAYREIASAASRLSRDFDAKYDEMMGLPVGGCR